MEHLGRMYHSHYAITFLFPFMSLLPAIEPPISKYAASTCFDLWERCDIVGSKLFTLPTSEDPSPQYYDPGKVRNAGQSVWPCASKHCCNSKSKRISKLHDRPILKVAWGCSNERYIGWHCCCDEWDHSSWMPKNKNYRPGRTVRAIRSVKSIGWKQTNTHYSISPPI